MLDKFWESPISGLLMPLRRSVPACVLTCFVLMNVLVFYWGSFWLLIPGAFAFPALILFLSTEGRTVAISSAHDEDASTVLLRAVAILRGAGFAVSTQSETSLKARRGSDVSLGTLLSSFWIEPEWHDVPFELSVTVKPSDRGSLLEVRGRYLTLAGVGSIGESIKTLLAKTAAAVAALDPVALAAADRNILCADDFGLRLGGLTVRVSLALLAASLLSMEVLAWRSYVWMWQEADIIDAAELQERAQEIRNGLTMKIAWAINDEFATIQRLKEPRDIAELAVALPQTVASFPLFVGATGENGIVQFEPRFRTDARAPVGIKVSNGHGGVLIQRQAQGMFYGQIVPLSEAAARSLGTKSVVLGTLLSLSDIERLAPAYWSTPITAEAPRLAWWWLPGKYEPSKGVQGTPKSEKNRWLPAELVIWEDGKSIVRLDWRSDKGRGKVHASMGAGSIPDSIVSAVLDARARRPTLSTLSAFVTPSKAELKGIVREENRGGTPWLAGYFLWDGGSGTALQGFSYAAANSPHRLHRALFNDESAASTLKWIISFAVLLVGLLLASKLTRPIFEIKDALKSIADGNFSVRMEIKSKDELGQLAAVVNKAAEGLKRREAINELLGKYMSRQVAEAVMKDGAVSALAGAQREVSVLFADVRGFTSFSERHAVSTVVESLNEYFAVMVDIIASREGVLDKYLGDGLMAVFNAPHDQPDHAQRAVITALEMQGAIQSLNLKRAQRGEEPIAIGIGVNTGIVISGRMGSVKRMEFTVIGDTVNLASRLESHAQKGQILIGPGTFEKVKGIYECEALGKVAVKGKREPVEVWLVKGLKAES